MEITHVSDDVFLNKIASIIETINESLPQKTESVAVTANEELGDLKKENEMEDIIKKEEGCAPTAPKAEDASLDLEAVAAKDKAEDEEKPAKEEDKKEEKAEEPKEEKPADKPEAKKEIKEEDFKKAEDLLKKVLENEKAEADKGEDESEDIKNLEEAMKALGIKVAKEEKEEAPAGVPTLPEPALPVGDELPAAEPAAEEKEEELNPFASLVATLNKKATIADSVWLIKNASDNSDYLSFSVKAAFGDNIDNDKARSAYAVSEDFGKAVIAALINEKVASATGAKAAVLGVVAHYTPSYPGVNEYKDQEAANPGKSGTKVEVEDDKNLPKVEAAAKPALAKTAAEECCAKDTFLEGADKRTEKVNTKVEESATPKASEQIPTDSDRKLIASYEEQLKKQAAEIQTLKLEAAVKEKAAKVKEAINLMVRAGMIKANEQVRVAALRDGLSVEAANAKAMAASIDNQSKNLFGMNTPQLDSYMKSLAELSPRATTVQASSMSPLTVKASAMETEEERLRKILGWE